MTATRRLDPGIVILRATLAVLLTIHGVYRIASGGVTPFGGFLDSQGFPAGVTIAWAVSLFEIAGGALLLLGRWVVPVSALFIAELLLGIGLVHAPNGWFVVGGGRNGAEYSVCLVAGFAALIVSTLRAGR